jgi:[ribosomal protein S18]-alanine N-acetyltransferase
MSGLNAAPTIVRLAPEWEAAFGEFLVSLRAHGDEAAFHPHPLTTDQAAKMAGYSGSDLYYLVVDGGRVLAYGMLRGWDEGYEVPSLGIAVEPGERSRGLALCLMHFLHFAARRRGARAVRLTVGTANRSAIRLYERLGYQLEPHGEGELLGMLTLEDA